MNDQTTPYIDAEYIPKVLIVDDVQWNIQVIANILAEGNYDIFFADNGYTALQLAATKEIDMMLLDIMMPDFDGFEVCAQLKSDPLTKDIPVIFITAKASSNDIIQAFQVGGQDYITKPFNRYELLARVKTHTDLRIKSKGIIAANKLLEEKVEARTMQLQQANKRLLELDGAKNDFLTLINHELRTPLNSISGYIQLMKKKLVDTELQKFAEKITTANNELLRITEISLLFTAIKADNYTLYNTKIDVAELCDMVRTYFEGKETTNKIQFKVQVNKNIIITTDSNLLYKALVLIVENFGNQSSENNEITLMVEKTATQVIIGISDLKTQFSEKSIKIFSEIFITENIDHHSKGIGLELATAKLIINLLGGEIKIANNEKNGVAITLTLKAE